MQISLKNTKDNKNWIRINFIWAVIVFTPIGLTYPFPQYSKISKKCNSEKSFFEFFEMELSEEKKY